MLDILDPLGPLHILVLHLPIGGFVALWFAWLASSNRQQYVYSKSFLTLNLFLLLTTGLSVATGWLYSQNGSYGAELDWHTRSGYVFMALVLLQFFVLITLRKRDLTRLKLAYYLLFICASATMVVTSHLGGELVHGKGFVKKAFRQKAQAPETAVSALAMQIKSNAAVNSRGNFGLEPNASIDSKLDFVQSDVSSNQSDAKPSDSSNLMTPVQALEPQELDAEFDPFAPLEETEPQELDAEFDPFAPLVAKVTSETDSMQAHHRQTTLGGAQSHALRSEEPVVAQSTVQWDLASAELAHNRFNQAARVLKNHCYSCHGATKVKGGLRLDSKELAMTAGDSGEVSIIPFDAQSSLLITRMLLPQSHDDVMPPSSKAPVDVDELTALINWIDAGAIWDTDIVFVPDQSPTHSDQRTQVDYETDPLDVLTQANIQYQMMGWDDPRIRINLSSHSPNQLAQKIETLLIVKERVTWLDLSQVSLSRELAEQLVAFENLERLKLIGAQLEDGALQELTALNALAYLNLYQTNVTDSMVDDLSRFANLRKVFLAETLVTATGVERLRAENSDVKIVYR